jgi:hypothetical protein
VTGHGLCSTPNAGCLAKDLAQTLRHQTKGTTGVFASSKLTDTHDFNGDGKSDILWHDGSGNVAMWLMNGAQVAPASVGNAARPEEKLFGMGTLIRLPCQAEQESRARNRPSDAGRHSSQISNQGIPDSRIPNRLNLKSSRFRA